MSPVAVGLHMCSDCQPESASVSEITKLVHPALSNYPCMRHALETEKKKQANSHLVVAAKLDLCACSEPCQAKAHTWPSSEMASSRQGHASQAFAAARCTIDRS